MSSKDKEETATEITDVADLLQDHENLTVKKCRKLMAEATDEYRFLRDDPSSAATARRYELARALTSGSKYIGKMETLVELDVPLSATKEPFRINETVYWRGRHVVPASVAQVLLGMIDANRQNEVNLLKQNNRDFDLGDIGQKARHAEMQR